LRAAAAAELGGTSAACCRDDMMAFCRDNATFCRDRCRRVSLSVLSSLCIVNGQDTYAGMRRLSTARKPGQQHRLDARAATRNCSRLQPAPGYLPAEASRSGPRLLLPSAGPRLIAAESRSLVNTQSTRVRVQNIAHEAVKYRNVKYTD
jgi:hypothetical protein